LPVVYQNQVCYRLRTDACELSRFNTRSPWYDTEIPLGKDIRYPEIQEYLKEHWSAEQLPLKELPDLKAQVFTNSQGDSLLALDNHLEMMIKRDIPPSIRNLSDLLLRFGTPQAALPISNGQLLSYSSGWSVRVTDDRVSEIWISELTNAQ